MTNKKTVLKKKYKKMIADLEGQIRFLGKKYQKEIKLIKKTIDSEVKKVRNSIANLKGLEIRINKKGLKVKRTKNSKKKK